MSLLVSTTAHGGSIRYELPSLLGEHRYDGTDFRGAITPDIDTPFGFYGVTEARLVVEGRVTKGKARGDGVIREDVTFDLLGLVTAVTSFQSTFEIFPPQTPETFRLEEVYFRPFTPRTTPLPNPAGNPPISFHVGLSVSPFVSPTFNNYPPLLEPRPDSVYINDGVIVDVPIIVEIVTAYIVFSGPSIVPEPSSLVAGILGALGLLLTNHRRTNRS